MIVDSSRGHQADRLRFYSFNAATFPQGCGDIPQVLYLRTYLADLHAASVVEEPHYFDRDYLAEFGAFYSTSARGYSNACRRIHVFSCGLDALRNGFVKAIGGDATALEQLLKTYLGFCVIRPIPATPLGRTVLRWYPETSPQQPRVTAPSRRYSVHLAGLSLHVDGLAWQQQDTAVGACATVALWSMFHSSALDEHHAIPTTAVITKSANARWPLGRRIFPASDGLSIYQICEAIRAQGLQPAVLEGDVRTPTGDRYFSPVRFAASCAALIRSGYPVLIGAATDPGEGGHAVCAVGFRPGPPASVPSGEALEEDGVLHHLYVHDDNLGPSVRFAVGQKQLGSAQIAELRVDPPSPLARTSPIPDPTGGYWNLVPNAIVAALPEEIRMTSDYLYEQAMLLAKKLSLHIAEASRKRNLQIPGVTFAARFYRLREYLGNELAQRLSGPRLAKARLGLVTRVPPMSLHIGVARIGIAGTPLFDVLYDTTDSQPATGVFAHVVYQRFPVSWLGELGVLVRAY